MNYNDAVSWTAEDLLVIEHARLRDDLADFLCPVIKEQLFIWLDLNELELADLRILWAAVQSDVVQLPCCEEVPEEILAIFGKRLADRGHA